MLQGVDEMIVNAKNTSFNVASPNGNQDLFQGYWNGVNWNGVSRVNSWDGLEKSWFWHSGGNVHE